MSCDREALATSNVRTPIRHAGSIWHRLQEPINQIRNSSGGELSIKTWFYLGESAFIGFNVISTTTL
jgi:hypothetical protein